MRNVCQSCEIELRDVVESCDSPTAPYLVCRACHARLLARSLRPREWFNLAKRVGPSQPLLHDDFYDDDGNALQPSEPVEGAERFPAPSLTEVSIDASILVDYTITRWEMSEELAAAWRRLPSRQVLEVLTERFERAPNEDVRSDLLEIASVALGECGADFVRAAWKLHPHLVEIQPLVRASAACLPFAEGFERATSTIAKLPPRELRGAVTSLRHFQNSATLDWIEIHVCEPTTEDWGILAAASKLSWPRARAWLSRGGLLKLVAIDALLAIAAPRTFFSSSNRPALLEAPTAEELRTELRRHLGRDAVPRVEQRIEAILKNVAALSAAEGAS
jgi:hypothetical protein